MLYTNSYNIIILKKSMEKQGKLSSFQEYSESAKSDNNKISSKQQELSIYEFDWFPITTSPWIASVSFLFQLYFVVHTFDFYADNACPVFGNTGCLSFVSPFIVKGMEVISFTLNVFISAMSVLALIFNKSEEAEGYKYILSWIGSKLFPFLRYLLDINLAIAAIFLVINPFVSFCFILAAFINLIINFFGQNYTLRKDYLCCKSMEYLLMWKISLILGFAINCAGYYLIHDSKTILMVFLIIQFVIFASLLTCFFIFGFVLYRHTSSQLMLLVSLNIFCAIALGNFFDTLMALIHQKFVPNRNLVLSICFFVFLCFMSYCLWTRLKKNGSNIDNKDSKKKNFFLFNKLENSSQSISDDCQVRGIIRYHLTHTCSNPMCFINQGEQTYYDAKKNKNCYSNKLNQGKTSFIKFIAKCAYEQELERLKWNNTELLLDYIEFYYMKLKNLFKVTILLVELEKRFLSPFQRIRLTRLRRVMREENLKLNQQLYNGSLDLENLITAENKFDEIQLQLKQVLLKNLEFWKHLENDSINLSSLVKMLKPNFLLIDKINNNWKNIAKYFDIQKVWKFMFVCYTLYIRNEKIKPQLLEQFGQSVHEDQLFAIESQHIDKTTEASKLFVSKMIFEQDVCCIHINHSQDKPIIKSVSRYFERIFGYSSSEIIESSLEIMMTPCFRQFHRKRFLKWAGEGKSNKQNNYQVKKVFPVNKDGYIVSTFKFYKQFLCLNRELQYVAMFKKNKEEENVILLNDNYEIQGMTKSLVEKLQLNPKQYHQIIGLNLLLFAPGLIEYTKFEDERENLSEEFIYANETATKNNLTHDFSDKAKYNKKMEINTKKQFTKNNVGVYLPQKFQYVRETYNKQSAPKTKLKILTAVAKTHKHIRQQIGTRRFKVEIEVRQIKMEEPNTYLQFYLRQIELVDLQGKSDLSRRELEKESLASYQDKINQEDINKFFENSQNSQNISLVFSDNMFIKEDNNEAVQMISHVKSISLYVRIIFLLFFGLLIGSLLFEESNYESYKQDSKEIEAMMALQLQTFALDNKYHSQLLNITGSQQTVYELTNNLRNIRQKNLQFKKATLDKRINRNRVFYVNGPNNNTDHYDQLDIIDKMFQNIIQILYDQAGDATINFENYNLFQAIVLPSIEELTTSCIENISKEFEGIYKRIQIKNNVYIGIGLILLILGFFLVFSSLLKITKSFVSLMEIFTQFSEIDLKKITKYCMFLNLLFAHLIKKYDQFKENEKSLKMKEQLKYSQSYYQPQNSSMSGFKLTNTSSVEPIAKQQKDEQDNANLNKKVKKVQNGKELTNLKLKSVAYVIVFLVLYGLSTFGLNLYTIMINKSIENYKSMGLSIFQYYSAINIYVLSMKDRAIYQNNYDPSRYKVYRDRVNEMKTLKQEEVGGFGSNFMELRNNILFGNVCQLYPDVLTLTKRTQQQCYVIAQNNFQHGIQSYLFYMVYNVDFYLNSTSFNLDQKTATQIETGLEMCNAYLLFMLNQWSSMFIDLIRTLDRNIIIICSSLFIFQMVIYFILIEFLIVGNLKQKFLFFKKIYNNLVPDFIVTKEKIIKAKLQVEGIIKK